MGERSRISQHRVGLPAGTWSLAALSVAACLCSVLGAKLLSNMFDPPGPSALPRFSMDVAADAPGLARSAPQVEAPAPKKRRDADVDYLTTGTIPDSINMRRALTPCGEAGESADQ